MKKVYSYIFVHDQQIVLDCDNDGKFKNLPDVNYVFLGIGETDKIRYRKDVIIARNLEHNIEQYPKFCSFTGWYALWKNNFIASDYINLLEYDILIKDTFNKTIKDLMEQKYEFIGYIPLSMHVALIGYPHYLANITHAIKKHYNIDIEATIVSLRKQNSQAQWSSSSNSTFSIRTFNQYMTWFEKLIDDLKDNPMSGHAHERSITFFNLIFNKRTILTNGLIEHFMANKANY